VGSSLILSVNLVTSIMGRSVQTLSGTLDILNEVFCFFPQARYKMTVYNLKQANNATYEFVILLLIPFDALGHGIGFV